MDNIISYKNVLIYTINNRLFYRLFTSHCFLPLPFPLCQATSSGSLLPEYIYPLLIFPLRAAYSHSASVGKRYALPVNSFKPRINSRAQFQRTSTDTVVYSKTKIAVVANVKTDKAYHAGSHDLFDRDFMLGIRFLDPNKNLFVIVKFIFDGVNGWENYLHIVKLDGQLFIDTDWSVHLGKIDDILPDFPLYHKWFVHDSNLFVYDNGRILCTDGSQSVSHPFSEIFNDNSDHISNINDLAVHPTLPFGVMIEDYVSGSISHQLTVVCWEAKKPMEQIIALNDVFEPLFGLKRIALAYQNFSPVGDWYVVGCIAPEAAVAMEEPKYPFFIAIPIDNECPKFLVVEKLILLGQVKNMTSLAWTTGLASYVISNGELLHKWDLDELPAVREFVVPADGGKVKGKPIFRKIKDLLRLWWFDVGEPIGLAQTLAAVSRGGEW